MPTLEEIEKRRQQNKKGFQRKKRRPWDLSGEGVEPASLPKAAEKVTEKVIEKVAEKTSPIGKSLEVTPEQPESKTIEAEKVEPLHHALEQILPFTAEPELSEEASEGSSTVAVESKPTQLEPSNKVSPVVNTKSVLSKPVPQPVQTLIQPMQGIKPPLAVEYRVRMLRGLKKKLLKIIVNSCLENSTYITPPLFMEDLIQMTGKNKVILKARLSDLKATGLVIAHSRRGVGGYYQFEIDQEVINAVKKYF